MAGPGAGVVFSRALAPSWQEHVERYVNAVASSREGDGFWVSRMTAAEWSYDGIGRPFILNSDDKYGEWTLPWACEDHADCFWTAASYQQTFGLLPDHRVSFYAMCNSKEDHRILGELVLAVVEQLAGVIDMDGLVLPGSAYRHAPGRWQAPWEALKSSVQAFNQSMPGIAVAATYETAAGHQWASHTVDATFLRAWMQHPEFHMIK